MKVLRIYCYIITPEFEINTCPSHKKNLATLHVQASDSDVWAKGCYDQLVKVEWKMCVRLSLSSPQEKKPA